MSAARRPLLMDILPARMRGSALHRFYDPADPRWRHLYIGATLRHAEGVRLDLLPTDFMHAEIAFSGCYELELTRRVEALAKRGGLLVDVGANVGYFSLIWAAQNPINKVLAFEAAPRPGVLLAKNVAQNGFAGRIVVHSIALSATAGSMHFDQGPDTLTGWGGLSLTSEGNSIEVEVRRLDEIMPDTTVDLLKIDVEGADTWVLLGAERLLAKKRIRQIVYEQNLPRMQKLAIEPMAAAEFLDRMGYRTAPMPSRDKNVVNWIAEPS
jgi:FkbM family methyltransferase